MKRTFSLLLSLLMAFSLTGTSCARADVRMPNEATVDSTIAREDILKMVNQKRLSLNEHPLILNGKLQLAAQKKAEDMAKRGWFAHLSPEGEKVWPSVTRAGYRYLSLGENLAVNFDTATSTVAAWIKSPKHYENIAEEDFRDTGIGIAVGTFGSKPTSTYIVQIFGRSQ